MWHVRDTFYQLKASATAVLSSPGGKRKFKGQFTANTTLKGENYTEDIYVIEGQCVNDLLSPHAAHQVVLVQGINETTAHLYGLWACKDWAIWKSKAALC